MVEAALVADFDSGIVLAGFACFVLCFPSLSSGSRCAASCSVWTRRTVEQRDPGLSVEPWYLAVTSSACITGGIPGLDFLGDVSDDVSVFSAMLGSTADTIFVAVYGAFAVPRTWQSLVRCFVMCETSKGPQSVFQKTEKTQ